MLGCWHLLELNYCRSRLTTVRNGSVQGNKTEAEKAPPPPEGKRGGGGAPCPRRPSSGANERSDAAGSRKAKKAKMDEETKQVSTCLKGNAQNRTCLRQKKV